MQACVLSYLENINDLILHAIFADGCAAAVISSVNETEAKGQLVILDEMAYLLHDAADGIQLGITVHFWRFWDDS